MVIKEIEDQKQWNAHLLSRPTQTGVFLQSFEWGEFQKAVGRNVYRFESSDAFAQVIELPLPLGKKYWFIPRGAPIEGLVDEARKRGTLFVRIEPPQSLPTTSYLLRPTKPISPPQTLLIDLTKSEDELLAVMHEKTRYNIKLADRKNVRVRTGDFGEFWNLLNHTAKRDQFHPHPRFYYEKMLKTLSEVGEMYVRLHMAYLEDTPIAGAIIGYFGDTATYLHGASSYEHRALMGPYALHWQIMQDAKKAGYRVYDFWGIHVAESVEHRAKSALSSKPLALSRQQSWQGMTRFKMGFGGQVVNYPGTFDLPLSRFWYTVYRLGRTLL